MLHHAVHDRSRLTTPNRGRHPQNRKYMTLQRCHRRTEPRPQATYAKKIGEDLPNGFRVMLTDEQTDRQTDIVVTRVELQTATI